MSWAETCHCGNNLFWWRSKTGYLVCMRCAPHPYTALEVLARRGKPGLVRVVQSWGLQDAKPRLSVQMDT
jgi:hypothetical protein